MILDWPTCSDLTSDPNENDPALQHLIRSITRALCRFSATLSGFDRTTLPRGGEVGATTSSYVKKDPP
jgi:hypothetical protein